MIAHDVGEKFVFPVCTLHIFSSFIVYYLLGHAHNNVDANSWDFARFQQLNDSSFWRVSFFTNV